MSETKTIQVDIVSAERAIFSGAAEMVFAMGAMGQLGIAPKHSPLLTTLKPGLVRVKKPEVAEEEVFYVSGGILEVQPNSVSVLSDTAVRAEDIDEAEAKEARDRAEKNLAARKDDVDYAAAATELAEAAARLRAVSQLRNRK